MHPFFLSCQRWVSSHPGPSRWLLAGPGATLTALATLMAMPLWLPIGRAGIDNIAFPILLTPLLWAIPFFYACLAEDLPRAGLVLAGATLLQGALVALSLI